MGYQIIDWHKLESQKENGVEKYGVMVGVEAHRFPFYNRIEKGGQPQVKLNFVEEKFK